MNPNLQFSGGEYDTDKLSEEEYFGVSSSSGEEDDYSFENDSEAGEMADDVQGNDFGADPVTSEGDVLAFRSAEDFVDQVFKTEEEAYAAYKQFAPLRGFGVRQGDVARINGVLVRRDFFFHRQGTRHEKHYDHPERVQEEKLESRTGCTAKLKIYLDAQGHVWKVRRIDDSHNHPLAASMFNHLLPSHRNFSESDKAQVDSLKKFGIATSKIMAYMAGQLGGYGMLRFAKRDLSNYVHSQRMARINDGDAAATISYLEGKANADMMSVARYTKTLDDRLGSLFWADGQMMADYKLFGDVLAFDATYRSKKYKKPLVVFSRSNHHKQTAIFGFVLLEDEEVRTYRWVLLNLVDVMDNKKPSVVVTDEDKAMRAAITKVLPSARHRLCGWHLEKNCVLRMKEPEFWKVFKKEIYANFDVFECEEYWMKSVQSLGLMNNSWVKSTYDLRHSWATAYLRGTFCASYSEGIPCCHICGTVKVFLAATYFV